MKILIVRFDAPLMAFGGPSVDALRVDRPFPCASMLTGLIGNALGWDHSYGERLNRVQERLRYAARIDRPGKLVVDYQTVDLGQDFMTDTGWTTWGRAERRGGTAGGKTHIRYRHYRAGAIVTAAVTLVPENEDPPLEAVASALRTPERPLFIGRKSCIPSAPVFVGTAEGQSLLTVLRRVPSCAHPLRVAAQWPADEGVLPGSQEILIVECRDWNNQIHVGETRVCQGMIDLEEPEHV